MNAVVVLCLVACLSLSLTAELAPITDESWQYLLLAQFWPGSSCIYFRKEGCHVPPGQDRWTIHGLWPSRNSSDQPEFCNNSMKFDYTEIKVLQTQLDQYWPNYNGSGQRTDLWAHEWEKHGTCAYSLPAIQGELKYFNATLQLYSQLNIYEALSSANILPSKDKQYNLNDVFSAVANAYKIPQIECSYAEGKHYLDQIYLCYDKSLQPVDCLAVHLSSFSRSGSKSVQKLRQSLFFESENFGKVVSGQAATLNKYFVDCPKNDLVYYIPKPQGQAKRETRVHLFEHISES